MRTRTALPARTRHRHRAAAAVLVCAIGATWLAGGAACAAGTVDVADAAAVTAPRRAQLLWLAADDAPPGAASAVLDIAALAPALAARGIDVVRVEFTTARSGGAGEALARALAQAEAQDAPSAPQRRVLGGTGASSALLDAALHRQVHAGALAGVLHVDPAPVAPRRHEATALPLLLVFDRTCAPSHADAPAAAAPAALAARLRQCHADRDARFVDGTWPRAIAQPDTWLAVIDFLGEGEGEGEGEPSSPPRGGHANTATALTDIEARVLQATLADYLAAFVHTGMPAVAGRPAWPAVDGGAAHYLHLGATVRAARDPLVEAVDLRDARAATPPAADCRTPDCPATR
jgi:hypothetical protein